MAGMTLRAATATWHNCRRELEVVVNDLPVQRIPWVRLPEARAAKEKKE